MNEIDLTIKMPGDHTGHESFDGGIHYEMAQIGSYHPKHKSGTPEDKNTKSIWVYAEGDRPVPHFHFYRGKDRKSGGCIVLNEAKYFPHDGHNDTLADKKELIRLLKFLNTKDSEFGLSVWKVIIGFWNRQNPKFPISINTKIPPYQHDMPSI